MNNLLTRSKRSRPQGLLLLLLLRYIELIPVFSNKYTADSRATMFSGNYL